VNWITALKDFWWYGYSRELYDILAALTDKFTSPSLLDQMRAVPAFVRGLLLKKR